VFEVWQIVVAMVIVSNNLVTFMMMTFNSVWDPLWQIATVCDAVMVINIFVGFFVVYIDHRGVAYGRCSVIAKKYLRGMFAVDVLAAAPLDYIFAKRIFMTGQSYWWAIWRLNRSLGLIRVIIFLSEFSSCICRIQGGPKNWTIFESSLLLYVIT